MNAFLNRVHICLCFFFKWGYVQMYVNMNSYYLAFFRDVITKCLGDQFCVWSQIIVHTKGNRDSWHKLFSFKRYVGTWTITWYLSQAIPYMETMYIKLHSDDNKMWMHVLVYLNKTSPTKVKRTLCSLVTGFCCWSQSEFIVFQNML